ncbi:MAG: LytR family transcriptional regulator, partial [Actinobacteria bacterium]|nr:LytR family transcriptional regulator [Actinomycetota bacterium]
LEAAFPDATFKEIENFGRTFRITVGSDYDGVKPVVVAGAAATANPDQPKTAADDICA